MSEHTDQVLSGTPEPAEYAWRWNRDIRMEFVGLAAIWWVLFPVGFFFAAGAPGHPGEPAKSLLLRLGAAAFIAILGTFFLALFLMISCRRVELDRSEIRIAAGLGPTRAVPRSQILGVRPRRCVAVLATASATDEPVRIARRDGKDISVPHYGPDLDEMRRALAARLGWAGEPASEFDRIVLDRLAERERDGRVDEVRTFRAKRVTSPITMVLVLIPLIVVPLVGGAQGLPLFEGEGSPLLLVLYFLLAGAVPVGVLLLPWLAERRRGGVIRRIEIDPTGVRFVRSHGVETWPAEHCRGARVCTFQRSPRWGPGLFIQFPAAPRVRRRVRRIGEREYRAAPGEIAAEMVRCFGEGIAPSGGADVHENGAASRSR